MALDGALGPHVLDHPLMARKKPDLAAFEARVGHAFKDRELLQRALTHISAAGGAASQSYQRLEFLGDRVLGLAMADMLIAAYPHGSEGDLSRRLSELVRKETCAEVAEAWGVGPCLRLGGGEAQSGVRRNRSVLADACEAIIGAAFLDAGYEAARGVVERAFAPRMRAFEAPPSNPKAMLQEWALGRGLPVPVYSLGEQLGPDHAPRFRMVVAVAGLEPASGGGASKRMAEQEAARALLAREGIGTGDGQGAGPAPPSADGPDEAADGGSGAHDRDSIAAAG